MMALTGREYWEVVSEIDASFYCLEQLKKRFTQRDGITRMVDEATGFDKHLLEEIKELSEQIAKLQAKLPSDDPHFAEPKNPPKDEA